MNISLFKVQLLIFYIENKWIISDLFLNIYYTSTYSVIMKLSNCLWNNLHNK